MRRKSIGATRQAFHEPMSTGAFLEFLTGMQGSGACWPGFQGLGARPEVKNLACRKSTGESGGIQASGACGPGLQGASGPGPQGLGPGPPGAWGVFPTKTTKPLKLRFFRKPPGGSLPDNPPTPPPPPATAPVLGL